MGWRGRGMAMDIVALKLNLVFKNSPTNLHFQSAGFDVEVWRVRSPMLYSPSL
jgi:hypothetical protein